MDINGIHHVTAITGRVGRNLDFYTRVLGLRLVKKSVNQDDVSAYHLFYADKVGSPGTDMTFFDWPDAGRDVRGTDSIAATAFRVDGKEALDYWARRLADEGIDAEAVTAAGGRRALRFEDPEGQRLMLVDDGGAAFEGQVWDRSDVPAGHAIRGFFAVSLSVPSLAQTDRVLSQVLGFRATTMQAGPGEPAVYEIGSGGPGREVWVTEETDSRMARQGAGGVHHVAFRVADAAQQKAWRERVVGSGLSVSPVIDRFYFRSIYFRISGGILFEIATDGPGFATDEEPDRLGEKLALPPFLEPRRGQIEAGLKPIVAARS